jgi:predicted nucleotide-binding protein (sugar kinase/HSP70/actin superfamily)
MASAMGPCRFGQYVLLQRMILNRLGYSELPILSPSSNNAYQGLDEGLRRRLFESFIISDILTKCLHRTRPYEIKKGDTDRIFESCLQYLEQRFESGAPLRGEVLKVAQAFEGIERKAEKKPLVGIVGEIYIRSNPFCNEGLIRAIEDLGYEAWLVPALEWMLYSTTIQQWNFKVRRGGMLPWAKASIRNRIMERSEGRFYREALPLLEDRLEPPIDQVLKEGGKEIPMSFHGEAILTVGRASLFKRDGVSAIVNCLPFGCMPGNLTSALLLSLQNKFGIPVVNVIYDGKGGVNESVGLFLRMRLNRA